MRRSRHSISRQPYADMGTVRLPSGRTALARRYAPGDTRTSTLASVKRQEVPRRQTASTPLEVPMERRQKTALYYSLDPETREELNGFSRHGNRGRSRYQEG